MEHILTYLEFVLQKKWHAIALKFGFSSLIASIHRNIVSLKHTLRALGLKSKAVKAGLAQHHDAPFTSLIGSSNFWCHKLAYQIWVKNWCHYIRRGLANLAILCMIYFYEERYLNALSWSFGLLRMNFARFCLWWPFPMPKQCFHLKLDPMIASGLASLSFVFSQCLLDLRMLGHKKRIFEQDLWKSNWISIPILIVQARLASLAKRAEYQNRQAALAQDLPESKRWIDPEIIERNFRQVTANNNVSYLQDVPNQNQSAPILFCTFISQFAFL